MSKVFLSSITIGANVLQASPVAFETRTCLPAQTYFKGTTFLSGGKISREAQNIAATICTSHAIGHCLLLYAWRLLTLRNEVPVCRCGYCLVFMKIITSSALSTLYTFCFLPNISLTR